MPKPETVEEILVMTPNCAYDYWHVGAIYLYMADHYDQIHEDVRELLNCGHLPEKHYELVERLRKLKIRFTSGYTPQTPLKKQSVMLVSLIWRSC